MLHGTEHLAASGGLPAFAHANGWEYAPTAAVPALGSSLWERASSGAVRDRVSGLGWEAGRIVPSRDGASRVERRGGLTYTTSVSGGGPTIPIDYFALTLPRRLPNMVLDARGNDHGPFSSLQTIPLASQRLSLEGDFDSHFRLYVPTGYERDALYVFTPDLMALLIDETGDLDVEIRDDRLIITRPGGFDFTSAATWERFGRILETVGAKAWDRTDMYLDERTQTPALQFGAPEIGGMSSGAGPRVAPAGRRVRRLPFANSPSAWIGLGFGAFGILVALGAVVFAIVVNAG
ncbi:hypothetical protein ET445_12210 [Agromyces protaetiae]|uniref:Uncharacterized protein n=1 Tax=Agromyces protaetiae TaxID=2509455 RepID=A0A4P6FCG1_9MICO|nr:hypothetical protein [Agromyces protaetiae]QAY73990.1 hypothetical protein ET445_12210 [Agromyces protaetiae]